MSELELINWMERRKSLANGQKLKKLRKGKYKLKVKIIASGNENYNASAAKIVNIIVRVK